MQQCPQNAVCSVACQIGLFYPHSAPKPSKFPYISDNTPTRQTLNADAIDASETFGNAMPMKLEACEINV
ncbi:hypothetical protein TNCV_2748141 [Trichonephila clavipes]|nr:hypothetical protein TNCV_2748141 [Trichonephila clavipes]